MKTKSLLMEFEHLIRSKFKVKKKSSLPMNNAISLLKYQKQNLDSNRIYNLNSNNSIHTLKYVTGKKFFLLLLLKGLKRERDRLV